MKEKFTFFGGGDGVEGNIYSVIDASLLSMLVDIMINHQYHEFNDFESHDLENVTVFLILLSLMSHLEPFCFVMEAGLF